MAVCLSLSLSLYPRSLGHFNSRFQHLEKFLYDISAHCIFIHTCALVDRSKRAAPRNARIFSFFFLFNLFFKSIKNKTEKIFIKKAHHSYRQRHSMENLLAKRSARIETSEFIGWEARSVKKGKLTFHFILRVLRFVGLYASHRNGHGIGVASSWRQYVRCLYMLVGRVGRLLSGQSQPSHL